MNQDKFNYISTNVNYPRLENNEQNQSTTQIVTYSSNTQVEYKWPASSAWLKKKKEKHNSFVWAGPE